MTPMNHIVIDVSSDDEDDNLVDYSNWLDGVLENFDVKPKSNGHQKSDPTVVDEDDDCVVLDDDPYKTTANDTAIDTCESDEVLVVGQKGEIACRDYPHPRHACAKYPFESTSHHKYCEMCHCYVCDTRAPCAHWCIGYSSIDHCHANDKDQTWKNKRESIRTGKMLPLTVSKLQLLRVPRPQNSTCPLKKLGIQSSSTSTMVATHPNTYIRPGFRTKQPNISQRNPGYRTEQPRISQQNPGFRTEQPNISQQNSGYRTEQPRISQQNPGYRIEQPRISQQNHDYRIEQPRISQQNPGYRTEQPRISQQNPGYRTEQQRISQQSPGYRTEQPSISQQNPAYRIEQPIIPQQNPVYRMDQPRISQQNPGYRTEQPRISQQNPGYRTEQPRISQQNPGLQPHAGQVFLNHRGGSYNGNKSPLAVSSIPFKWTRRPSNKDVYRLENYKQNIAQGSQYIRNVPLKPLQGNPKQIVTCHVMADSHSKVFSGYVQTSAVPSHTPNPPANQQQQKPGGISNKLLSEFEDWLMDNTTLTDPVCPLTGQDDATAFTFDLDPLLNNLNH